ncbi:MAG TPA: 2-oxoglutarate and iron-dependent oxygenase domain-containing protein, partial [Paraburkholderia sp.]|nr:2-oxoglutarate and iron-dependent oxygenase domain-containing protein [Paraburkholderia sp.]
MPATSVVTAAATARIPIIDLAGVRGGDRDALARAGREIRDACTTIGFFYIVNHGVPQAAIDRAEQAAR